jgi:hypothetical protein
MRWRRFCYFCSPLHPLYTALKVKPPREESQAMYCLVNMYTHLTSGHFFLDFDPWPVPFASRGSKNRRLMNQSADRHQVPKSYRRWRWCQYRDQSHT